MVDKVKVSYFSSHDVLGISEGTKAKSSLTGDIAESC